jgi:hypothetical protein
MQVMLVCQPEVYCRTAISVSGIRNTKESHKREFHVTTKCHICMYVSISRSKSHKSILCMYINILLKVLTSSFSNRKFFTTLFIYINIVDQKKEKH